MSEYSEISYLLHDHELVLFNKIWGYWSISPKNLGILINIPRLKNYMRAFRVLMVIYFSFLYNVNSLGISRRYWRISSSSFEVKQYLPPPSASPREVGRYCITSQDSEDILQYLLEMPRLLSHCAIMYNSKYNSVLVPTHIW